MSRRSPLITVMANAAYKAAKGLARDFGEVEQLQVSKKGPADFVSSADHKAEASLVEDLQRSRPKFGFLLEEGGVVEGADSSNTWIIDPLDGTTNFLHGIPHFAISIGLERDSKMYAGVIYDPLRDELFWAETGVGAFINSKRLRVSSRRSMSDAVIATGMPFKGRASHPEYPRMLDMVAGETSGVGPGRASARRRSIWPMSRPGALTGFGNLPCRPGILPPGWWFCVKPAAWLPKWMAAIR